jgi:hypothetical protein
LQCPISGYSRGYVDPGLSVSILTACRLDGWANRGFAIATGPMSINRQNSSNEPQ